MEIKKYKIYFWGTGSSAQNFCRIHQFHLKNLNIIGFIDRNEKKHGKLFNGYYIFSPSVLSNNEVDCVVILSCYYKEIRDEILKKYALKKIKIYSIDEFDAIYLNEIYESDTLNSYPLHDLVKIIHDNEVNNIEYMFAYMYIKKNYSNFIMELSKIFINKKKKLLNVKKEELDIWVCWLQGIDQAPDIVKCCINSIKKNVSGKLHIITANNYHDFVTLEPHIIQKWKDGIIKHPLFSDLLRLALLVKYGGIWIDATCLIMDTGLPQEIYLYPLFMYRSHISIEAQCNNPAMYSNWFIATLEQENSCLNCLYQSLIEWWRNENIAPYFLTYYMHRLIMELLGQYFTPIPLFFDNPSRSLLHQLNEKFDQNYWNWLQKERSVQKLSYKEKLDINNTFYGYILDEYLNL